MTEPTAFDPGFRLQDCPQRRVPPSRQHPHSEHYVAWQLPHTSGRILRMASLHQHNTYGGQLCGLPTAQAHHIEWAIEHASQRYAQQIPGSTDLHRHIAVLPPELISGKLQRTHPNGSEHEQTWLGLPAITSIARLDSSEPRDARYAFSSVIIVWWQDTLGPPDARASAQLAALDWNAYAWGWEP